MRRASPKSRSTTRRARSRSTRLCRSTTWAARSTRCLVEGQIQGGAIMGLGLGVLEEAYPRYPSPEHRGEQFGAYLVPAMEDLPELENVILENPSADGPFGAKAIGEMANNAQRPRSARRSTMRSACG